MVKAKIEKIIREEMAAAGSQEVFFPALLPREPPRPQKSRLSVGSNP
jgi:prolyl-tRNA synthetase